jgi:hypothetical protein
MAWCAPARLRHSSAGCRCPAPTRTARCRRFRRPSRCATACSAAQVRAESSRADAPARCVVASVRFSSPSPVSLPRRGLERPQPEYKPEAASSSPLLCGARQAGCSLAHEPSRPGRIGGRNDPPPHWHIMMPRCGPPPTLLAGRRSPGSPQRGALRLERQPGWRRGPGQVRWRSIRARARPGCQRELPPKKNCRNGMPSAASGPSITDWPDLTPIRPSRGRIDHHEHERRSFALRLRPTDSIAAPRDHDEVKPDQLGCCR